jgi:hypothetical protein
MRIVALAIAIFLLGVGASRAESNQLLRFYYSPAATGRILESPADPKGKDSGAAVDSTWKGDLELILFRRLGIGGSRQNVLREYQNSAHQAVHEEWVQYSYNLTLYLREAGYDRFNAFLGGGGGNVERYQFSFDKVRQDTPKRDSNMPLTRWFGGIDYTFQHIGFRYEYSAVTVEKKTPGFKDHLNQAYHHIGFFIPFN